MQVLLCVSGLESASFVRRVMERVRDADLTVALLYIIDERSPEEIGYVRRQPAAARRQSTGTNGESELAIEVLAEATAALTALKVDETRIRRYIARGRPGELIVAHAVDLRADVIAIGSRHRGAPVSVPRNGPPSIGPVARYVLDHAPCDILLLR